MQLTFLQAAVPLTKKYTKRSDGRYDKTSYPNVVKVTSHTEEVEKPEDFAAALRKHASAGNCLHTGSLDQALVEESRRGHHIKDERRTWIMLDLDGLDYPSVEAFISDLPEAFHDVSYVSQHSPSSGLKPGLNQHIFFLLDREENMDVVSDWLKYMNLVTKPLRDQVTLSASGKILSFKLDWIANKNGRVVYIAHPECVGFADPIDERVQLVEKRYDEVRFSFAATTPTDLKNEYRKCLDELRAAAGMPKLRGEIYETTRSGIEALRRKHTERGRIHDCQQDTDVIMRCNIDGGDSHAYFYYINAPTLIRNHKGEPAIYMEAFDPEYYSQVAKPAALALKEKETQPFVFRNINDDKYYIGLRLGEVIIEQPNIVGSENKIEDYFVQHNAPGTPSPIESWTMRFDPTIEQQWNPDKKVFNSWRRSDIMANALYRTLPPTITTRIIQHVVGGDGEAYHRFINWLAYIYQTRTKTGTAWIFHGIQGTGKGLLVDKILRPIFGKDYVVKQQSRNLRAEFNSWMEKAILVNLDEFDIQDAGVEAMPVMQALKMWITDEYVPIRAMRIDSRNAQNYANFILTTNAKSAMPVDPNDRRFSFGQRQEEKLIITPEEVAAIDGELHHFAGYLSGYKVDAQLAHTCLENDTKEQAKRLSLTSIEEFVDAVHHGDLQFFLDAVHERSSDYALDGEYKLLLDRFIDDAKKGADSQILVHELLVAYQVICKEDKNTKGTKFRKIMAHKSLPARRLRMPKGQRPFGWRIKWNVTQETLCSIGGHIKAVKSQEELEKELQAEVLASPTKQS